MRTTTSYWRTLTVAIAISLSACATTPDVYQEAVEANKPLYRDIPETIVYELQPMDAEKCGDKFCLSRESIIMVQDDRKRLLMMFDLKQREVQQMTQAYNNMLDASVHMQTSIAYTERRADAAEKQLERERNRSAVEKWLERIIFIGGVALFGLIP